MRSEQHSKVEQLTSQNFASKVGNIAAEVVVWIVDFSARAWIASQNFPSFGVAALIL